jgi:hypothetical protein
MRYRIPARTLRLLLIEIAPPLLFGLILGKLFASYLNHRHRQTLTEEITPLASNLRLSDHDDDHIPPGSWLSIDKKININSSSTWDTLWVVTPTFCRPEQDAALTQLAQALLPSSRFVKWLIFDEFEKCEESNVERIRELVQEFGIWVRVERTKKLNRTEVARPKELIGKGVMARRAAINYLREIQAEGVLYFADDDNTYDSDIFRQVRSKGGVLNCSEVN